MPRHSRPPRHDFEPIPVIKEISDKIIQYAREAVIHIVTPQGGGELPSEMRFAMDVLKKCSKPFAEGTIRLVPEDHLMAALKHKPQEVAGIYVVQDFSGPTFQMLIKRSLEYPNMRIYGPLAIIQSIDKSQGLPKGVHYPLYSFAMKGLKVCFANSLSVDEREKRRMKNQIRAFGGIPVANVAPDTNILIGSEIQSTTARAARKLGIPIVTVDWINSCWEQKCETWDAKPCIPKNRVPLFQGLVFTVTQLNNKMKRQCEAMANRNGGTFSPQLVVNDPRNPTGGVRATTHLICDEATLDKNKSEKYKGAKFLKNILIVDFRWLTESLRRNQAVPEDDYIIEDDESQSIPSSMQLDNSRVLKEEENSQSIDIPNSMESPRMSSSAASVEVGATQTLGKLTLSDNITDNDAMESDVASYAESSVPRIDSEKEKLLSLTNIRSNGFDGQVVYLVGFDSERSKLLKTIIRRNEGYVSNNIDVATNVCVVGKNATMGQVDEIIQKIQDEKNCVCEVVKFEWLVKTLEAGVSVPWDNYLVRKTQTDQSLPQPSQEIPQTIGFRVLKKNRTESTDTKPKNQKVVTQVSAVPISNFAAYTIPRDDSLLEEYGPSSQSTQTIRRSFESEDLAGVGDTNRDTESVMDYMSQSSQSPCTQTLFSPSNLENGREYPSQVYNGKVQNRIGKSYNLINLTSGVSKRLATGRIAEEHQGSSNRRAKRSRKASPLSPVVELCSQPPPPASDMEEVERIMVRERTRRGNNYHLRRGEVEL